MLNIDVYSTQAVIRSQEPLTVGLVGGQAHFRFSHRWRSLIKTVVFRQGNVTKDVVGVTSGAVIPWEVLQEPGLPVEIGIYGCDSSGKVMIPTVWAVTDPVREGADPMLDASAEVTPEVHQQLLTLIDEADKATYTAAAATVDGVVVSNRTVEELAQAYNAQKVLQFYDSGYVYALEGIGKDGDGKFIFTFRCKDSAGDIRIAKVSYPNVLERSTLDMATKADTRAAYRVTVEQNSEGLYVGNRTIAELVAAYQAGKVPICYLGGRECCLTGTGKDSSGAFIFYFAGASSGGGMKQVVRVYAPNGDQTASVQAAVTAEIAAPNLAGYSMLGRVGIIGDSLSNGTVDVLENGAAVTRQELNDSWAAWLSRSCGNPWLSLGVSGITSATWIRDGHLDTALAKENLCDAYIIGLGYNDNRYSSVPVGTKGDINGTDTMLDSNEAAQPYGSFYFNMEKILRHLSNATGKKSPIFVLTNPDFSNDSWSSGAKNYNQAIRDIIATYGSAYNAHLIDLWSDYGAVYQELESSRGAPGHYNAQAYAYMGQLIGTAISNYMLHHPGSFAEIRGYIPEEADPVLPAVFTVSTNSDGTVNRSVDDMTAAYQAGQSLVLYDGGYMAALEGIGKDSNGEFIYTFRCHDKDGNQKVYKVSVPNVLTKSVVDISGSIDLTGYATTEYVNEVLENVATGVDHQQYFDIDDGVVSLKEDYRGVGAATYPASVGNGLELALPDVLVIPNVINGIAVTAFAPGMFYTNERVREITLPATVTVLPDYFCNQAVNLKAVNATEQVTSIGIAAFNSTRIKNVSFPNLTVLAAGAFVSCAYLEVADIGKIPSIPNSAFGNCARLRRVVGGEQVTSIGSMAFYCTRSLRDLPLLAHVTSVEDYAFFGSRICTSLSGDGIGTKAFPTVDNDTDFWSGVEYTPCQNRITTKLSQRNPEWKDEPVLLDTTDVTYSGACPFFVAMHIHSAITGKYYSDPRAFIKELEEDSALSEFLYDANWPENIDNVAPLFEALGYRTKVYGYTGNTDLSLSRDDYKALVDALAQGAYVYTQIGTRAHWANDYYDGGHAVMLYGINDLGEVCVLDSDVLHETYRETGFEPDVDIYTYTMPYQNLVGPSSNFVIVYPPNVEPDDDNSSGYTLPVATSENLGGVMPVDKTEDMTQSVGVDAAGGLWTVPGGGSASGVNNTTFLTTLTTEEALKQVTVSLPVDLYTALLWNIHITIPNVETEFALVGIMPDYIGCGTIPVSADNGVNIYAIRHTGSNFAAGIKNTKDYSYAANPVMGATWINRKQNVNEISFYSNTADVNIPAGTKIEIWGICE